MRLVQAVAVDHDRLVLEFSSGEFRLYRPRLAEPSAALGPVIEADGVRWQDGTTATTAELLEASRPLSPPQAGDQSLQLGQCNRAPTEQHPTHHVYAVAVRRLAHKPFMLVESIRGGHGEAGGSRSFTLAELREWPEWKAFFAFADCAWAIPVVRAATDDESLADALTREVCRRRGV